MTTEARAPPAAAAARRLQLRAGVPPPTRGRARHHAARRRSRVRVSLPLALPGGRRTAPGTAGQEHVGGADAALAALLRHLSRGGGGDVTSDSKRNNTHARACSHPLSGHTKTPTCITMRAHIPASPPDQPPSDTPPYSRARHPPPRAASAAASLRRASTTIGLSSGCAPPLRGHVSAPKPKHKKSLTKNRHE
jgi:hypothetical protein